MGNNRNSINTIDQLKNIINIADFIGKYVKLTQKGNKWVGCCPFHKEKTPSFSVSDQFYYCFGCHSGGDVIKFVQNYNNVSFSDAVKKIADECGLTINMNKENESVKEENEKKYGILFHAKEYYSKQLLQNKNAEALQYVVKKRKLTLETITNFDIGFSPSIKNQFYKYLVDLEYSKQEILESGLIKEYGTSIYDFFDGRIIIPIKDNQGRTIGFGGRIFKNETTAKYINSSESDLFKKRETLFNFAKAKQSKIKDKNSITIMVEGYMDVIMMSQFNFNGGIAPLGTGVTEQQIKMAFNIDKNLYFCFNSDTAGVNASLKVSQMVAKMLINTDLSPKFINLEPFKDVDELLNSSKNGSILFNEKIKNANTLNEFLWFAYSKNINIKDANKIAVLEDNLIKFAETIPNSLIKKSYVRFFKQQIFEFGRKKQISVSVSKAFIDKTIPNLLNEYEIYIIGLFVVYPDLKQNEEIGIENIIVNFSNISQQCYQMITEDNADKIESTIDADFYNKLKKVINNIQQSSNFIKKSHLNQYFVLSLDKAISQYTLSYLKSSKIDINLLKIEQENIENKIKIIDEKIDDISNY